GPMMPRRTWRMIVRVGRARSDNRLAVRPTLRRVDVPAAPCHRCVCAGGPWRPGLVYERRPRSDGQYCGPPHISLTTADSPRGKNENEILHLYPDRQRPVPRADVL